MNCSRRPGGWRGAAWVTGAALAVLLEPWCSRPPHALWAATTCSAHGLLFAGLAWFWGRRLPGRGRGWPLWITLTLLAAWVEIVQPWLGRTGEWPDAVCAAAGAGVVCASWRWGTRTWARVLAVALVSCSPLGAIGILHYQESRAFPLLLAPGSLWARTGWQRNGVELRQNQDDGVRVDLGDKAVIYPGLFRTPARKDWRKASGLRIDLHWPAEHSAVMVVRVDDRPDNPAYAERFQREFYITQGWNRIWIAGTDLARTSGGRPMRMDGIRQWGVFLVSAPAFDYFLLGEVSLELP